MLNSLIGVLYAVIACTLCESGNSPPEWNTEATLHFMKEKIFTLESKLRSLESIEMPSMVQKGKDELSKRIEEVQKESETRRDELSARMDEMRTESKTRHDDISAKLEELLQGTLDTDKRISGMETELERVSGRLQKETDRFLVMNNHLLKELMQIQKKSDEVSEKVRNVEDALEMGRTKMENLELKENSTRTLIVLHIASQLDVDEAIRQNVTTSVEDLRQRVNESLVRTETEHSIFKRKMSNLAHLISNLERQYGNVSRLEERLDNLDKSTKAGLQSLRDVVGQRGDPRSAEASEVQDMLKRQASEIGELNKQLLDMQQPCADDPPSVRNGAATDLERWHGSRVRYECHRNFVMIGDSTVHCEFGRWEGQPPVCSYFDATFYAEAAYVHGSYYIECYSDANDDKIVFSRAFDTGSGEGLPTKATLITSEKSARMLFGEANYPHPMGAYRCAKESAEILVPFDPFDAISFPDRSEVANVNDSVTLRPNVKHPSRRIQWGFDGIEVPAWDGRKEVVMEKAKVEDSGMYGVGYHGNQRVEALLRLVVRRCKANVYGEQCDQVCPPCHNGGICHDLLGVCVCPEGFVGRNCETPCKEGFHGADCLTPCKDGDCKRHYYCKPDPFGCSCAPGFKGAACQFNCDPGWYGAGCKQPCHCASGKDSCNRFTGACTGGCAQGWKGESCQIKDAA